MLVLSQVCDYIPDFLVELTHSLHTGSVMKLHSARYGAEILLTLSKVEHAFINNRFDFVLTRINSTQVISRKTSCWPPITPIKWPLSCLVCSPPPSLMAILVAFRLFLVRRR